MRPQFGGLGHKSQDLVIPFRLGEGEPLTYFHLRDPSIRSELVLIIYQTLQIKNLTVSKMVGCHLLCIIPISFIKQDIYTTQEIQCGKL